MADNLSSPNIALTGNAALFSGVDVAGSSFFIYGGFTAAPWTTLDQSGVRIKVQGGGGQYEYDAGQVNGSLPLAVVLYSGQVTTLDTLIGYQQNFKNWSARLYLGLNYAYHDVFPKDPGNSVQGGKAGAKVEVDLWTSVNNAGWLAINANYATTFEDYWIQTRAAATVMSSMSLGVEAAAFGNKNYDASRIGAFFQFNSAYGDITLSAGYGGNYDEKKTPYISLNLYQRF